MEEHEHESIRFDLPKELQEKVQNIFYDKDESVLNFYISETDREPITFKVDKLSMKRTLEAFNTETNGTLDKETKLLCVYSIKYNLRDKFVKFNKKEQKWYSENFPNDPGLEQKIGKKQERKEKKKEKEKDKPKEVIAFKYSNNGKTELHESIILDGLPYFMSYDTDKEKVSIRTEIEEHARIIRPPRLEECQFIPYEFTNQDELNDYIRRAESIKSKSELYYEPNIFGNYMLTMMKK